MSWSRVLECARKHPTFRLKSEQSGICWSLPQMCKNSPHFETQKCTIWHLLKPSSNVQEITPLGNSKKWHVTLLLFLWHVNASIKGSSNPSSFWQVCVQKKQNGIKLNLIAFFPPHSCMQLSNWGLVRTAFDESGCVYQALDWCQTPSGYLFWLTLDYHPSLFAP